MNVTKNICELYVRNVRMFVRHLKRSTRLPSFDYCCRGFSIDTRVTGLPAKRSVYSKAEEGVNLKDDFAPNPQVKTSEEATESIRFQKIKKALHQHLKSMQEKAALRADREHEFEVGCRHLANMMGADYNNFTQADVDRSIEYLMPSGLFDLMARPKMKPPEELYKSEKGLGDIDETGRPTNSFFYTGRGEFYFIFYHLSQVLEELNRYEDKMFSKGFDKPPPETKIFLDDSDWISLADLKIQLADRNLPELEYNYLIQSLERLVQHPYSFRCKNFIDKYRVPKLGFEKGVTIPPLTVGEDGIPYAEATGYRKWTRAEVTVKGKGSGEVNICGMDISYFPLKQDREQLLFPLKFSGMLNQVDFEARLRGPGGHTAEAGAIRHGLSQAIASFVSPQMVEKMRLAGLLQRDLRTKERLKVGQKGARAKYKWVKR